MPKPETYDKCPACRMGLVTHITSDPQCIGHEPIHMRSPEEDR